MANHYAPPQANVDDVTAPGQAITDEMIESLRGTKGWVLLVGILGLVGSGFMVLGGVGILFSSAFMRGAAGGPPAAMLAGMGVGYLVFAIIYVFPSLYLIKYSSAIGRLLNSGQAQDMEDALHQQRKFWKLIGVLFLVIVVLFVVGMIAAIAVPLMALGGGVPH